ncbi:hypothetical protein V1520DRAFT_348873 [Lipomyces starkeyi]
MTYRLRPNVWWLFFNWSGRLGMYVGSACTCLRGIMSVRATSQWINLGRPRGQCCHHPLRNLAYDQFEVALSRDDQDDESSSVKSTQIFWVGLSWTAGRKRRREGERFLKNYARNFRYAGGPY